MLNNSLSNLISLAYGEITGAICNKSYKRELQNQIAVQKENFHDWIPFWLKISNKKQLHLLEYSLTSFYEIAQFLETSEQFIPKIALEHSVLVKYASITLLKKYFSEKVNACDSESDTKDNITILEWFETTLEFSFKLSDYTRLLAEIYPVSFLNLILSSFPIEHFEKECEALLKTSSLDQEECASLSLIVASLKIQFLNLGPSES